MSIIKGILKSKAGDELRPLTSTDQVELEEGGKRLDEIFDESGKVKSSALPDILNKFKGVFSGEAALPESGEAGDYAICTDTDTVWIWDAEKEGGAGWSNTGNKGSVSSVNGKTGDVVIEISDIDGLNTQLSEIKTDIEDHHSSISTAQSTAEAAATTAAEIDFAIVENGAGAPTNLRDAGIYFEKDATAGAAELEGE